MLEATPIRGEHHDFEKRRAGEVNAARRFTSGCVQRNGRANSGSETNVRCAL